MRRRWRRDARPRRRGGPAALERPAGGAPVWGAGAAPSSDSRYTERLGCDDVVHDADACVVDDSPLGEADLFQHALRGEVVGIGHGHEPRQPQGPERMADEPARGFGGDPLAPAVACETIGQLDVVARRHPEQGAEAVGDAGTTLHEPEAQRRLILGDALSHPRGRLVGRSCPRRAAHVAHDFRVAVERDEVALVGGTQPSQPEVPNLALSWKALNDTTWEVKLRQGVKFHDGSPFTARDVKATFERVLDPTKKMTARGNHAKIKSVEIVDDHTVKFHTDGPYPIFVERLTALVMASEKVIKDKGHEWMQEHPIGTGPYKLVKWDRKHEHLLVRNDEYWGPKAPYKYVRIRIIPEQATQIAELISGGVDVIKAVPPDQIDVINKSGQARTAS